jgi:hypothetical protein
MTSSHAHLYSCLGYVSIVSHLPITCIHYLTDIAGVFLQNVETLAHYSNEIPTIPKTTPPLDIWRFAPEQQNLLITISQKPVNIRMEKIF